MADLAPPPDLVSPPPDLQPAGFPQTIRNVGERSGATAVSPKGALGNMQVMPATAASPGFGVQPIQAPTIEEFNRVGDDYAAALLKHYDGNRALAAAAYNAGPGQVEQWVHQFGDPRQGHISDVDFANAIPFQETRDYTHRILATPVAATGPAPADEGPPQDLISPPPDLVPAPAAAPAPKKPKLEDPNLYRSFTQGLESGVRDIGKGINVLTGDRIANAPEKETPHITGIGDEAIDWGGLIHGLAQYGKTPDHEPTTATQPYQFRDLIHPIDLLKKVLNTTGESAPSLAAATVGGPVAAGAVTGAQAIGPYYQQEIVKTPHDPAGALTRAKENAAVDGVATALTWKLFEFMPFKHEVGKVTNELTGEAAAVYKKTIGDTIKNLSLQGLGIQGGAAVVTKSIHNVMDGKPWDDGLPEAYTQGAIGNTILAGIGALVGKNRPTISKFKKQDGAFAYDPSAHNAQGEPIDQGAAGPSGGGPRPPQDLLPPQGAAGPGQGPKGPAPAGGAPAPDTDIGLKYPDGRVERATVKGYSKDGKIAHLEFEDGSIGESLTSEVVRDMAPPPINRAETPPPNAGQQLGPNENVPPFEGAPPPAPSPRAQARIDARAPKPNLFPEAAHALDLAQRLETAALDETLPMSTQDRMAALTQAARLRQSFTTEGEETRPGAYRHPLAGVPAADIGELATPLVTHPDLYQGEYQRKPEPRPVVSQQTPQQDMTPPKRPEDLLQFLGRRGGLKGDDPYAAGDLQAMDAHRKLIPGAGMLVRKNGGIPLDKAREAAAEAGFGEGYNNFETVDDLLSAIRDNLAGKDIFPMNQHEGDRDTALRWQQYKDFKGMTPETDRRADDLIHSLREQADHHRIPYGEDWTAEDLMAAVTEREAMAAERAGEDESQHLADARELDMDYHLASRWPEVFGQLKDEGVAETDPFAHEGELAAQPEAAAGVGERRGEAGHETGREEGDAGPGGHAGESGEAAPAPAAPETLLGEEEAPEARRAREGRRTIEEAAQLPRAHNNRAQKGADVGLFAPPPEPSLLDLAQSNANPEPSAAAIHAGNYKKGHVTIQGVPITIETPSGAHRRGKTAAGEDWSVELQHPYGYVKRTTGADGEQVDVYVGSHPDSPDVFVIDQKHPATGAFDEHKAVMGARTEEEARDIYEAGFSDGSGPARLGAITAMSVDHFRDWLDDARRGPLAYREPAAAPVAVELPTKADLVDEAKGLGLAVPSDASREQVAGAIDLREANLTPDAEAAQKRDEIEAMIDREAADILPEILDDPLWSEAGPGGAIEEPETAGRPDEGREPPNASGAEEEGRPGHAAIPAGGGDLGREGAPARLPDGRPVDSHGNPVFKQGERVVLTEGPLAGRHGEISRASGITMRTISFGGERRPDETTYHYTVRTDEGAEVFASKFEPETVRPVSVIRDPHWEGKPIEPTALDRIAASRARDIERFTDRGAAARKPEKKAEWAGLAKKAKAESELARQTLDAWKTKNAFEAAKLFPEKAAAAAPVETAPKPPVSGVRVTENADRNGVEVRFDAKPDAEVLGRLKAAGFKWSKPQKLWYARRSDRTLAAAKALQGEHLASFKTTPGAIAMEHAADVSRLEAEGAAAAVPSSITGLLEKDRFEQALNLHKRAWKDGVRYDIGSHNIGGRFVYTVKITENGRTVERGGVIHQGGGWGLAEASRKAVEEAFPGVSPTARAEQQGAAQAAQAEQGAAEYQPAAMPITAAAPPPPRQKGTDLFSIGDEVAPTAAAAPSLPPRDGSRYVTDVSPDGRQVTLDGGAVLPSSEVEPISGHGLQKPVRPSAARGEPGPVSGSPEARGAGRLPAGEERRGPQAAGRTSGAGAEGPGRLAERPPGPPSRRGQGEIADAGLPRAGEGSGARAAERPDALVKGRNFSIEPGEVAEGRGPKTKATDNLSAIALAKRLIGEDRPATREEQAILAKYVGWGGLSGAFENSHGKYGTGLEDVGRQLKELLTPDEYSTAKKSTQYAHYTAENVIRSMWDAVSAMGFKGGNVFEPGMGVGHFLGMMPSDIADRSQYQGIELDHLTADIAKLLYPQSGVRQADFTETPLPDNSFDLVIGNPPFSDTIIKADPKYAARGFMLHDYFFAKSLDAVRPGGLLGFVTSAGTMNKMGTDARQYLAERAEFLGGVRLPSTAFKKNAGTEVTTDVLFFKKRDEQSYFSTLNDAEAAWTQTVIRNLPDNDGNMGGVHVNRYFSEHPEQVLGQEGRFDKLYQGRYAVHAPQGVDLTENLRAALDRLPKDVYQPEETPRDRAEMDFSGIEHKDGSFYLQDGRLMQYSGGAGRPVERRGAGVKGGISGPDQERVKRLIPIRDALRDVFSHDLADRLDQAGTAREALNRQYDAFVQKFGPINKAEFQYRRPNVIQQESARAEAREQARDRGEPWHEGSFNAEPMFRAGSSMAEVARARAQAREAAGAAFDEGSFDPAEMPDIIIEKRPNIDPFIDDPESYRLRAIEDYNDATGDARKKRIFYESVLTREQEPNLKSANDGVLWSLNKFGRLELDNIAAQMGRERGDIVGELGNSIFKVPNTEDAYQTSDEYLSGDIPDKLAIARSAAQHDPDVRRNVEALEAAMPAPLAPSEISMTLGMPWLPPEDMEAFARDRLRIGEARIRHNPALGGWTVHEISAGPDSAKWGIGERAPFALLSDALNRTPPRIYKEVYVQGEGKKREFDAVATQSAQDKYDAIRQEFTEWLESDSERHEKLAGVYNDKLNRTVLRKFDGSYLTTPGVASDWSWRPHQQRVVARIIQSGNTYVAHAVGAGKAQPLDAKILTPDGWKRMGDISVGDIVIAGDGTPTRVEAVFPQGEKDIYRVEFSDGSATECCDEHLWLTQTYRERGYAQKAIKAGRVWECAEARVRPLSEIREAIADPRLGTKNHSIPMVGPVQFAPKACALDPYLMGALLGDGCFRSSSVSISSADADILSAVRAALPDNCELVQRNAYDWNIAFRGKMQHAVGVGGRVNSHPVMNALRSMAVWGTSSHDKFIPNDYLENAVEVRVALLQGLMDTDGYVSKGGHSVYFTSTSKALCDGVTAIVRSLGGTTSTKEKHPTFTYLGVRKLGRVAYNVCLKLPAWVQPFRLPRKAALVVPKTSYAPARYIVAAVSVGKKLAQCIRVSHSSHLYVTDDFIVTHNTSEMIGAGMEERRLGLVKKPMYVVPNHMLAQFTKEFYEQYPTARIAVADERRFHTDRRKQFIANIAQDDLDAVIITHSAFGKIPISDKFQRDIIAEELDHIEDAMSGLDKQDDRITIKRLENQKEKLEQQLKGAFNASKDKTNTFEEMGVDRLFVDEAHQFRKLSFATRQSSLKGITPEGSQMAWDLYSKIRYLETKRPGRSVVLASGTPVTNTMGELFTISRYLQRQELQARGIDHFDSWSATFGDTKSSLEQTPDGGYTPVTRFARFVNIPELYKMVGGIMDVVTPAQLDQFVVRPKLKGGKRVFNLAPKTPLLENYQSQLAKRMQDIKNRKGPPKKGDDILLSVINDGRHSAIDMRFVDPFAPNDPDSKLNQMIANVHRIWKETKNTQFFDPRSGYQKPGGKGPATQMIFANLGIGNQGGERFSGYDWIKRELVRCGVPPSDVAFIRDYKSHVARQKLFNDMNEGKIRILVGSTQKMGTGVNAQRRLYAIHNQDPLWFPADDEQRVGRGLRQGNMNPEIEIHDYSTKGTYDATMWGMMGRKGRFIEQFFRGDPELRDMEDLGEASQYEQASAISTSDERLIQLTDLRQQLDKATRRAAAHDREQYSMRSRLSSAQDAIERVDRSVPVIEADIKKRQPTEGDAFRMKIGVKNFKDRGEAAEAMKEIYGEVFPTMETDSEQKIAELGGFDIFLAKEGLLGKKAVFYIQRSDGDLSELGAGTPNGVIRSVESRLPKFEDELKYLERRKADAEREIESLRSQIGKPFTGGEEISRLRKEVKDLEAALTPKKELSVADIDKQIEANQASYDAGDLTDDEYMQRDIELRSLKRQKENPGSSAVKAQVPDEGPVSEREFYRDYAQHIDLRGRSSGKALETRDAVLRDGFKKGFSVNAVPPTRAGEIGGAYLPSKGDVVYLAPRGAWKNTSGGMEIQNGWKPEPWEAIVITDPSKSMYENYVDAFHGYSGVKAQVEDAKPFYSALTRNIEALPQERAPAAQWSNIIDNLRSKGVKQDEIDWSGVKDWLGEQKGAITKADLLGYLRANEVQIKEVLKGGTEHEYYGTGGEQIQARQFELEDKDSLSPTEKKLKDWIDENPEATDLEYLTREYDLWLDDHKHLPRMSADELAAELTDVENNGRRSGPEIRAEIEWLHAFSRNWERAQQEELGGGNSPTRYSSYKLPGGENYRELLLTTPVRKATADIASAISKAAEDGDLQAETLLRRLEKFERDGHRSITQQGGYDLSNGLNAARQPTTGVDDLPEDDSGQFMPFEAVHRAKEYLGGPGKIQAHQPFRSGHWDEPNILAHVRFDDRTGPGGERILHIAEVQSDFGQQLRRVRQAQSAAVDGNFQDIVERMKKAGVLVEDCD